MPGSELLAIADRLFVIAREWENAPWRNAVSAVAEAARTVGHAWGGSNLGYQAGVYYEGFVPAPGGARFSQEWGLMSGGTHSPGRWRECSRTEVRDYIAAIVGDIDTAEAEAASAGARDQVEALRHDILSTLTLEAERSSDSYILSLKSAAERTETPAEADIADRMAPPRQIISRDMTAIGQGNRLAPHQELIVKAAAIQAPYKAAATLAQVARQAGSHLARQTRNARAADRVTGTKIAIGHGRSLLWRELKDFVSDRLSLPYDEFNRVSVAGVANTVRLSEMLQDAAAALIVLTAEDERIDGSVQARMNVIHEVGLFQGRLGFTKAIALLEEGCAEFSNIQGHGQIRFPTGNISAAFEDVRRVLEREGLIS